MLLFHKKAESNFQRKVSDLYSTNTMRRFKLYRHEDETGVSGTGVVAEGVLFTDGAVALRWLSNTPSTILYANIGDVLSVHGHQGKTRIIWEDDSWS